MVSLCAGRGGGSRRRGWGCVPGSCWRVGTGWITRLLVTVISHSIGADRLVEDLLGLVVPVTTGRQRHGCRGVPGERPKLFAIVRMLRRILLVLWIIYRNRRFLLVVRLRA